MAAMGAILEEAMDAVKRQMQAAKLLKQSADGAGLPLHEAGYHYFAADEAQEIRRNLLDWYDREQRVLPWRTPSAIKDGDRVTLLPPKQLTEVEQGQRAYEVWVSEIMLQQTQVATVIAYYEKWMAKWPTIHDFAKADLEDVNQVWSGLGYYSRARRMLEAAQLLVEKYNGILPKVTEKLQKEIPGIGPYTAGAVASIAYNIAAPLVDGNVIRVLSRLRALGINPKSKQAITLHWLVLLKCQL
ncbi:hypothetical protein HDU96_007947 [Phlyctochytrium bullatum]|nr:hypothetical protein HDU96_007947 [Phlyctochytrium bullatum]